MMTTGAHVTGTENQHFNLVSVLYHALESATTVEKYIQDAEQSGNQDLVQFFREVQNQNRQCADRAKQYLAQELSQQQVGAR